MERGPLKIVPFIIFGQIISFNKVYSLSKRSGSFTHNRRKVNLNQLLKVENSTNLVGSNFISGVEQFYNNIHKDT